MFTSLMIPGASEEQMRWLDDLQRVSVSASTAYLSRPQRFAANADPLLASLDLPTLILHSVGDRMMPFDHGRHLAANIAGARLVALNSDNHIVLDDEPAWAVFVDEVRHFLAPDADALPGQPFAAVEDLLSARELEVLRLVAAGRDNDEIAGALHLSTRTVERHLHNIYSKLGLQGRSARVAAAARLLAPV